MDGLSEARHHIAQAAATGTNGLNLSHLGLTELPPELWSLTALTRLDLSHNRLTALPPKVGGLSALTSMDLSHNRLSALPPELGQLTALDSLDLSYNQLRELPPELGQLTTLTSLNLCSNQLRNLPPELGQLTALDSLDLSFNRLSALPPEVGQLGALTILVLPFNRLSVLPPEVQRLTTLVTLDLRYNNFQVLPPWIRELRQLSALLLHGHPVLGLPFEVLGDQNSWYENKPTRPSDILNYYFAIREGESRPLHEVKLILVGQGAVGKTSLVRRLLERDFNPQERMTEGIAVARWTPRVGEADIRVNVWDFGGQEIMHATHQFFLTERCVYVVVLNAREDERQNRLDYWLKLVESFGAGSPTLVVGNQKDQKALDINRRALLAKYGFVKEILETSCATGEGISALRAALVREIAALPGVQDRLPGRWFAVKEKVEQLECAYLTEEDYRAACLASEVRDLEHQGTLARLMNELGTLLNFREDPRLAGTHFLKPRWVTEGVYAILNARALLDARGVLDWAMLGSILDDQHYPAPRRRELVGLMEKFELCFPFEEGTGRRWLVADLLPKESQAGADWEQSLAFEFHYPVLPNSVISRFIVRTHHLAKDRRWWRTGVVLTMDGNEALVQADLDDRRIGVWIRGGQHGRRPLLAVIRNDLAVIHSGIKALTVDERVPVPGYKDVSISYEHLLMLEADGEIFCRPEKVPHKVALADLLNGVESFEDRERRRRLGLEGQGFHLHLASGANLTVIQQMTSIQEATYMRDHIENITDVSGDGHVVTTSSSSAGSAPALAVDQPTLPKSKA